MSDINNNDNNVYFILLNKYKGNFSFFQSLAEKQKIFVNTCAKDEHYKELTNEQQTELYSELINIS